MLFSDRPKTNLSELYTMEKVVMAFDEAQLLSGSRIDLSTLLSKLVKTGLVEKEKRAL